MDRPAPTATVALVLAGGAARRFGSDKTRATLAGRTLLELVVDVASPLVDELLIIGHWAPSGHRQLREPQPGDGPLAALAFGLRQVEADRVLVLAADHPQLQPSLLQSLLEQLGDHDAVVPVADGEPQPLVSCVRPSVASVADRLLADGERRLRALLDAVDVRWVDHAGWSRHDPDGRSFLDVDHPGQLEALARSVPERQQIDRVARVQRERARPEHRER